MAFQLGAALTYISDTEENNKKVRASCTIVQNDIHIIKVSIGSGKLFSSIPRPPWFACKYNYNHNKCVLRGRVVDFAVVHYIYYDHNMAYIMYHCCYYIFFFHNFPRPTIILYFMLLWSSTVTTVQDDFRSLFNCTFRRFCFVSFCLSNIAILRRTRNIILHSWFTPK